MIQYNHYLSLLRLQTVAPVAGSSSNDKTTDSFEDLITFVAQCAQCYPKITEDLPKQLSAMLLGKDGFMMLKGDTRETAVRNLVMLRNKDVIDSITLLQTLLPLLPHAGRDLRQTIRKTILTDLKTSNQKAKNHRLNRVVQGLLFGMIESGMGAEVVGNKGKGKGKETGGEAMWAVMMVRELWRKGVWTDAKTVSIAALAAFHPNTKVQSAALHFFLGSDADADREFDSEDEDTVANARRDLKGAQHRAGINKDGRKRQRNIEKLNKATSKARKERAAQVSVNFPALELLHDPQTFGEKLYDNLHKHGEYSFCDGEKLTADKQYSLEHKVLIMQLLSRVMGVHKLCILGFYTYIIKYLTYHQLQVTLTSSPLPTSSRR
jgi:protein SDA1